MSDKKDHIREVARRMIKAYHGGVCWICGAVVDYEEQRGPRVYAHPCGHYLWDGKARGSLHKLESEEGDKAS